MTTYSSTFLETLLSELGKREMSYPQECGRRKSFYENHLVAYSVPFPPSASKMELCGLYVKLNNDLFNGTVSKPDFTAVQQKLLAHLSATGQRLYAEHRRRSRTRSRSRSRSRSNRRRRSRSTRSRSRSGSRRKH